MDILVNMNANPSVNNHKSRFASTSALSVYSMCVIIASEKHKSCLNETA